MFCTATATANTVKLIVSFPPGSGTDLVARIIAEPLGRKLGQNVVVENKPGAEGYLGATYVVGAQADGQTLLLAPTGVFITPLLRKNPTYHPERDFSFIARIGGFHFPVLLAPSKNPPWNIDDLLEKIRKGESFYGTGNITGILTTAKLLNALSTKATRIPYKGEGDALRDLAAGRLDWMFALPTAAQPFLANKSVQIVAVSSSKRSPFFSDTPSISEARGVTKWEDPASLVALLAPKGLNEETIRNISRAVEEVLRDEKTVRLLQAQLFEPVYSGPAQLKKITQEYISEWEHAIKENNLSAPE